MPPSMAPPCRRFSTVAGHSTSVWVCFETDAFVGINTCEDSMKDHLEARRVERFRRDWANDAHRAQLRRRCSEMPLWQMDFKNADPRRRMEGHSARVYLTPTVQRRPLNSSSQFTSKTRILYNVDDVRRESSSPLIRKSDRGPGLKH